MNGTTFRPVAGRHPAELIAAALYLVLAATSFYGTAPAALRAAAAAVLIAGPLAFWLTRREPGPTDDLWTAHATLRVAALGRQEDARRIGLYRRLVDELPIGLAILRLDDPADARSLRIVEMNPAGLRLAASEEPAAGRALTDFAPEVFDTELPGACVKAIRDGRTVTLPDFVSRERVPGGHFSIRIFPLGGPLAGLVFENVTAQKAAQDALARSNADLTQFAYVASHDLQEPLRKAGAFAEQLQRRSADRLDDAGRDFLARLQRALDGMQSLIDALLALARVSGGGVPAEAVDLGKLAVEVVDDLHFPLAQSGGKVRIDSLPSIEADPQQMRQLLQNLIGNAIKFHRPGRAPDVRVYGRTLPDGRAEFCVEDDGVGFDNKYAERLFQPFQRLHSRKDFPGSGIGLAICRKIVARHGGTIAVDGAVDRGALFTVVLPAARDRAKDDPQAVGGASWNRE